MIRSLLPVALLAACAAPAKPTPSSTPGTPSATLTLTPSAAATEPSPLEPEVFRYYLFHGSRAHANWDRDVFAEWAGQALDLEVERHVHDFYSGVVPTSQIRAAMSADPPFDVITATVGGVFAEYARQGQIADITDLWEANGWYEQFPQSVIDMASVDGRQYFVPLAQQWDPVWYRSDIFERQGLQPPESWQDLLDACEQLASAGYIPITVSVRNWNAPASRWFTMLDVRLNGLAFHREFIAGQIPWTDSRVRAVFEKWSEMFDHGCFATNASRNSYSQAAQQLEDGEAVMYLLGEWLSESYAGGLPETFDFFSVPPLDPQVPQVQLAHVFGAFIPVGAAHPELARSLLSHFGSAAVHAGSWDELGRVGTNLLVDSSGYPEIYRRGIEFVNTADALVPLFEVSMSSNVMTVQAFSGFGSFIADQSGLDQLLVRLEATRQAEYLQP